jgi:Barstar (barnase inhibitor)
MATTIAQGPQLFEFVDVRGASFAYGDEGDQMVVIPSGLARENELLEILRRGIQLSSSPVHNWHLLFLSLCRPPVAHRAETEEARAQQGARERRPVVVFAHTDLPSFAPQDMAIYVKILLEAVAVRRHRGTFELRVVFPVHLRSRVEALVTAARFVEPLEFSDEAEASAALSEPLPGRHAITIRVAPKEKMALLEDLHVGLRFPSYFGFNWDALDDCLRDFRWLSCAGVTLLHTELPRLTPEGGTREYIATLADAVRAWNARQGDFALRVVFPSNERDALERHILTDPLAASTFEWAPGELLDGWCDTATSSEREQIRAEILKQEKIFRWLDLRPGERLAEVPAGLATPAQLFDAIRAMLECPESISSWQRLGEQLRMFSWLRTREIVLVHGGLPRLPASELKTYLRILIDAVEAWQNRTWLSLRVAFPLGVRDDVLSLTADLRDGVRCLRAEGVFVADELRLCE